MGISRRNFVSVFLAVTAAILQCNVHASPGVSSSISSGSFRYEISLNIKELKLQKNEHNGKQFQLSEIFNLKNTSSNDQANSDVRPRPAVAIVTAPKKTIKVEYRKTKDARWENLFIAGHSPSQDRPYPLPHRAHIRVVPASNARGCTEIKVVAASLAPRRDPLGFDDLKQCFKNVLKEVVEKVNQQTQDAVYKAFKDIKDNNETVTIDTLISNLNKQARNALQIVTKVKQFACGSNIGRFWKWFDMYIEPIMKRTRTPCQILHRRTKCQNGKKHVVLKVCVPMDDRPIIKEAEVPFPPVPTSNSNDSIYNRGCKVGMMLKVKPYVLNKIMSLGKSAVKALREIMSGSDPTRRTTELLKGHEQRIAEKKDPCAIDYDGDALGMAILCNSTGIGSKIGKWHFKSAGKPWKPIEELITSITSPSCNCTIIMNPDDRLKFVPNVQIKQWDRYNTRLVFYARKVKDKRATGGECVDLDAAGRNFSRKTSYMFVSHLGCNGLPDSNTTVDRCGKCNGDDDCLGCDGKINSTATKDVHGNCYGGTTGKSNPLDCKKYCDNSSYVDRFQDICKRRNKKDCAGSCEKRPKYRARRNDCGNCVVGKTGLPANHGMDACGTCKGDNSSCTDCNGEVNGVHIEDDCGVCRLPDSADKCQKISHVKPARFSASTEKRTISCRATGVQSSTEVTCSLNNITTAKQTELKHPRLGVVAFSLEVPPMSVGQYKFNCTFKPSNITLEYTEKLRVFDNKKIFIKEAYPKFARLNKKLTKVVLIGSGYINTTEEIKCFIPTKSRLRHKSYYRAKFENSSSIVCSVPAINDTKVDKICVNVTSEKTVCTSFHIKVMAPQPVNGSCVIGSKLNGLSIKFDKSFKCKKVRSCSDLFSKSTLATYLNTKRSKCTWKYGNNYVMLQIKGLKTHNVVTGATLSLRNHGIKHAAGYETIYKDGVETTDIVCPKPKLKILRITNVTGTFTAGPGCSLTAKGEVKGSGRITYLWSASLNSQTVRTPSITSDLKKLNDYLKTKKYKNVKVPPKFVPNNAKYELSLTVKDAAKQTATTIVTLARVGDMLPSVRITIRKKTGTSSTALRFILTAKLSCYGDKVAFEWQCRHEKMPSRSRTLSLNADALRVGVTTCSVKVFKKTNPSHDSRASVNVRVKSKPLECRIIGGAHRSIGERDEDLRLRGESNDPDNDKEPMSYAWWCENSQGSPCDDINFAPITLPDKADITVNMTNLRKRVGQTFKFTYTIRKGSRSKECRIKVTIKPGKPPVCKIDKIKNADPDKKTKIRGRINSWYPGTEYEFSVEGPLEGILEEGAFSTPTTGVIRKPGRKTVVLIIKARFLEPNTTYRIQLIVKDKTSTGSVEIEFTTQTRPTGGDVCIVPQDGFAAHTNFTISACGNSWSAAGDEDEDDEDDDDNKLTYRCGIYRGEKKRYFGETSDKGYCETTLPSGPARRNHTVEYFIEACTFNDDKSCVESKSNVTVLPKQINPDDVQRITRETENALNSGDIFQVLIVIRAPLDALKNQENDGNMTEELASKKADFLDTILIGVTISVENGEAEDEESISIAITLFSEAVSSADEETLDKNDRTRISVNVHFMVKAKVKETQEGGSSRRKRRSVSESTPIVVEKDEETVEETLLIYHKLIKPDDFSNDSMTVKTQFRDLLGELGRSMCKGLENGENPRVAKTTSTVLRSEKNSFEYVDANYSLIGCDNCTDYPSKSAQVLLGKTLKGMYEDWNCIADGCNGACVVSSQTIHDDLVSSSYINKTRASDVISVQLFNPETLVAMAVSSLALPVTFKIHVYSGIDMTSSNLKCYAWDSTLSSWTTTAVTTLSKDNSDRSVSCSSNKLEPFTVFDVNEENVQPTTPAPATTTAAGEVTTAAPGEVTTAAPGEVTTAAPGEVTTAAPGEVTTAAPGEVTTADPGEVTTAASGEGTTSASTTATPYQEGSMEIEFSLNATFDDHVNSSNKDEFESTLTNHLASKLGVKKKRISNLTARRGSIVVSFVLLPGGSNSSEPDVKNLTATLKTMVESGSISFTTSDGRKLWVITSSFSMKNVGPSTKPLTTSKSLSPVEGTDSGLTQDALIGIIVGACLVVIVIVLAALYCRANKRQQVKDCGEVKSRRSLEGISDDVRVVEEDHPVDVSEIKSTLPGTPTYEKVT